MATNTTRNCLVRKKGAFPMSSADWFWIQTSPDCSGFILKRYGQSEAELTSVLSRIQLIKTAAMAVRPAERSGS